MRNKYRKEREQEVLSLYCDDVSTKEPPVFKALAAAI